MNHLVDFRERDAQQIPRRCPVCHAEVELKAIEGTFHVYGPADRGRAYEKYDIPAKDGDKIRWLGMNGYCPNDDWSWMLVLG
jgi:hypothetical protein